MISDLPPLYPHFNLAPSSGTNTHHHHHHPSPLHHPLTRVALNRPSPPLRPLLPSAKTYLEVHTSLSHFRELLLGGSSGPCKSCHTHQHNGLIAELYSGVGTPPIPAMVYVTGAKRWVDVDNQGGVVGMVIISSIPAPHPNNKKKGGGKKRMKEHNFSKNNKKKICPKVSSVPSAVSCCEDSKMGLNFLNSGAFSSTVSGTFRSSSGGGDVHSWSMTSHSDLVDLKKIRPLSPTSTTTTSVPPLLGRDQTASGQPVSGIVDHDYPLARDEEGLQPTALLVLPAYYPVCLHTCRSSVLPDPLRLNPPTLQPLTPHFSQEGEESRRRDDGKLRKRSTTTTAIPNSHSSRNNNNPLVADDDDMVDDVDGDDSSSVSNFSSSSTSPPTKVAEEDIDREERTMMMSSNCEMSLMSREPVIESVSLSTRSDAFGVVLPPGPSSPPPCVGSEEETDHTATFTSEQKGGLLSPTTTLSPHHLHEQQISSCLGENFIRTEVLNHQEEEKTMELFALCGDGNEVYATRRSYKIVRREEEEEVYGDNSRKQLSVLAPAPLPPPPTQHDAEAAGTIVFPQQGRYIPFCTPAFVGTAAAMGGGSIRNSNSQQLSFCTTTNNSATMTINTPPLVPRGAPCIRTNTTTEKGSDSTTPMWLCCVDNFYQQQLAPHVVTVNDDDGCFVRGGGDSITATTTASTPIATSQKPEEAGSEANKCEEEGGRPPLRILRRRREEPPVAPGLANLSTFLTSANGGTEENNNTFVDTNEQEQHGQQQNQSTSDNHGKKSACNVSSSGKFPPGAQLRTFTEEEKELNHQRKPSSLSSSPSRSLSPPPDDRKHNQKCCQKLSLLFVVELSSLFKVLPSSTTTTTGPHVIIPSQQQHFDAKLVLHYPANHLRNREVEHQPHTTANNRFSRGGSVSSAEETNNHKTEEKDASIFVRYRPHLGAFMAAVAEHFDVAVFTTGEQMYAEALLDVMDPAGSVFTKDRRFYRQHCTSVINRPAAEVADAGRIDPQSTMFWAKDLRLVGRPLDEVVLVDTAVSHGFLQPRNLLPIPSWTGDPTDTALLRLLPALRQMAATRNVYGTLDEYLGSEAKVPLYTPTEVAGLSL